MSDDSVTEAPVPVCELKEGDQQLCEDGSRATLVLIEWDMASLESFCYRLTWERDKPKLGCLFIWTVLWDPDQEIDIIRDLGLDG